MKTKPIPRIDTVFDMLDEAKKQGLGSTTHGLKVFAGGDNIFETSETRS